MVNAELWKAAARKAKQQLDHSVTENFMSCDHPGNKLLLLFLRLVTLAHGPTGAPGCDQGMVRLPMSSGA